MSRARRTIAAVLLVVAGCEGEASQSHAADLVAIDEIRTELRRLTREADVAGAMALFTDDAVYMRPREQADVGKVALTAHWQESFDEDFIVDIDWRSDEVEISGDLAYLRGSLTYTRTPRTNGAAPIVFEQRYVWVLRRDADGQWRIARYIRHPAPQ